MPTEPGPNPTDQTITHGIHGAAIYGNMDPINIPPMLAYIPYMNPMGKGRATNLGRLSQ